MVNNNWLVVYLPLWKIWVRQWEGWQAIYEMENNPNVPNHQPDKITRILYIMYNIISYYITLCVIIIVYIYIMLYIQSICFVGRDSTTSPFKYWIGLSGNHGFLCKSGTLGSFKNWGIQPNLFWRHSFHGLVFTCFYQKLGKCTPKAKYGYIHNSPINCWTQHAKPSQQNIKKPRNNMEYKPRPNGGLGW